MSQPAVRRGVVLAIIALLLVPAGNAGAMQLPGASARTKALAPDPSNWPVALGWGLNTSGEVGDGTVTEKLTPVLATAGEALDGVPVHASTAGNEASCAIAVGSLYCWGVNKYGRLGIGSSDHNLVVTEPLKVGGILAGKQVTAVSFGTEHACVIADGAVYCWGNNTFGQVGVIGGNPPYTSPQPVGTNGVLKGKRVTALGVGAFHTCVVADGLPYCWGTNSNGQAGVAQPLYPLEPLAVDLNNGLAGKTITSIAAGYAHTCATADGKMYCWGKNNYGQLGIGPGTPKTSVPTAVDTTAAFKGLTVFAISAGFDRTCAIAGVGFDRRGYCWGDGDGGSGANDSLTYGKPKALYWQGVLAGKVASSITVDRRGGCLIASGRGYCWGQGFNGRIGDGSKVNRLVPVPVDTAGPLNTRVMLTVNSGPDHTMAIAAKPITLTDVPADHPFRDDISWIAGSGIAAGYPGNEYQPGSAISRQAMAAFLFRFKNPGFAEPECVGEMRIFDDVPKDSPFCGAIEWLVTAKITAAKATFSPGQPVSRGVMAAWLFRSHHPGVADRPCSGGKFPDVDVMTQACGDIEWLVAVGVTTGYSNGTYRPGEAVTRQSMAAFMHRAQELTAH